MLIPNYVLKIDNHKPVLETKEMISICCDKGGYDEAIYIMKNDLEIHKDFTEHMYVLLTNSQNEFIGISELSHGSQLTTGSSAVRELLIIVLLSGATRFYLFHNHPDGLAKCSINDQNHMSKITFILTFINDIEIIDSIVINSNGEWTSCKAEFLHEKNDGDEDEDKTDEDLLQRILFDDVIDEIPNVDFDYEFTEKDIIKKDNDYILDDPDEWLRLI